MKDSPAGQHNSDDPSSGYDPNLPSIQNLFESSPDIICAIDKEGRFLYASEAAKTDWGYNPGDLKGNSLLNFIIDADQPLTRQMLAAARNSLVSTNFQNKLRCKDGRIKPTFWSVKWNAREELMYCIARDGMDATTAKEKAKEYEQRLYRAYKLAKLGWWEWNIQGEQINASDELYELFGISKEKFPVFSTGAYLSMVHPDDLSFVLENVAIFWKLRYHQYQHRIRKSTGEIIHVELNVQTLRDEKNNVLQVNGTMKDITEQKIHEKERAELHQKLREANESLLMALESMSDGFCTTDRNWTLTFMNQKVVSILGINGKENYIGKNLWACFPEAEHTRFYTEYHRAAAENKFVLIEEYYEPLNIWLEVSVYPNTNGLSFFMKDVSERKEHERELTTSNERFRLVALATSDAVWDWNMDKGVEWGEGLNTIFGYSLDKIKMDFGFFIDCIHPDDREIVLAGINKAISGADKKWVSEFHFLKADNSYAYVLNKAFIIRDESGRAIRMVGAIQDISTQKKQEKRLEFIAKATSEIIWERNIHTEEVVLSTAKLNELLGYYTTGNSVPQSFWLDKIHPEDLGTAIDNRTYAVQHGMDFYLNEYRLQKADGNWAYLKNRVYVIRDFEGKPVSLLGAAEDVTNQRIFEKTLMENQESYLQLFNNAPLPTVIHDVESFSILEVNNAIIETYGYSREELLSMTVLELHAQEEIERILNGINKIAPFSRNDLGVIKHVKKNGEQILVEVAITPILYKGRTAILATSNDVTEKLRLQKQIVAEKIKHQKSITKAVIEAQEKERSEIGTELHDNVNQLLAAAKLYVENIRHFNEQKDHFIDQSVSLLNKSINEIRRLSHALVTPSLRVGGLRDNLLALIETFQDLKFFEIYTSFDFTEEQIQKGLELTIYRILQESFNNTMKYANATVVSVNITMHQKELHVLYIDNGVGFDPAVIKKGIGLKNIINRAGAYRGKVKITTSKKGGFKLNMIFHMQES